MIKKNTEYRLLNFFYLTSEIILLNFWPISLLIIKDVNKKVCQSIWSYQSKRKKAVSAGPWLAGWEAELDWYWRWGGSGDLGLVASGSKYRRRGKHSSPVTFSWAGGSPRPARTLRMSVPATDTNTESHSDQAPVWVLSSDTSPGERRERRGKRGSHHGEESFTQEVTVLSCVTVTLPRPPVSVQLAVQLSTNF